MFEYRSNLELPETVRWLRDAQEPITLLTHAKPDGDALGAGVALAAALHSIGKRTFARFVPPIAHHLRALDGQEWVQLFSETEALPDAGPIVVLDTGAWSQLGPVRPWIEHRLDQTLIIDHHLNGDVHAAFRLIDSSAAATCEVLAEVIDRLLETDTERHKDAASVKRAEPHTLIWEMLFVGIASDTGWFRFSNTTPRTHRLAAELIGRGVNHSRMHGQLEQNERPEKLALLIRAMQSLKMLCGGRAAVMVLRNADFVETGAREEETERLIDLPQQVGTVQAIALISERSDPEHGGGPNVTRLSFRSKAGDDPINVAELAEQFGGGGHARAAGAKLEQPIDHVIPRVESALTDAVAVPSQVG